MSEEDTMMKCATERYTIKADGEEYGLELAGDWKTATVTGESGTTASISYHLGSYQAYILNMSGEADSMKDAVDIAIDLIRAVRGEDAA